MFGFRVFDMARTNLPVLNSDSAAAAPGVSVSICLSAVLLWIRETLVRGDMSSDDILRSNRQVITMRQASFQFDSRVNHCEYLDLKKSVIHKLLEQYRVKQIRDGEGDLFDFSDFAARLGSIPGYYLVYFKNPQDSRGHAIGFKFVRDGQSYLFDPAEGLFKFKDQASLIKSLLALNSTHYEEYIGGQYWYRQITLG